MRTREKIPKARAKRHKKGEEGQSRVSEGKSVESMKEREEAKGNHMLSLLHCGRPDQRR